MYLFYCNCENFQGSSAHKKQRNAGRYIIEYAAKNFYNIQNSELEIINNKPKFKYSDIEFSISHSRCIAAVCFDKNPIGLDIEKILPRDYNSIAERMNFILKENSLEEFYRQWTLYEANYKLNREMKNCYSFTFENEYIISIASADETDIKSNLRIQEIHL